MSFVLKGRSAPNRGKPMSQDQKNKISETKRLSPSKRKHSEETKRKMSIARIGKSIAHKGKPWSEKRRNAATLRQFPGGLVQ